MATLTASSVSPLARFYYLEISANLRRLSTTSRRCADSGTPYRSDSFSTSWSGIYDANAPTQGPLRDAYTPPRITPTILKTHLDNFVVGQERAKRTLATSVYNHYQRIQELQRRDEEEEAMLAQEERRRMAGRHPVEDEFPGQVQTMMRGEGWSAPPLSSDQPQLRPSIRQPSLQQQQQQQSTQQPPPLFDPTPLTIEKSNILLLGPSGVGKTLMAKTLARVLEVPFSMSDCTPFTQAGYIGEDAEVCVQRLLAAANYDVSRAERGIICLDEIDKIATARVSHGKDVSGEGVQQALLKIVEGTTVQVVAKSEKASGAGGPNGRASGQQQGYPPPPNMQGGQGSSASTGGGQKGETYNVKTDNILFICAGAFNGLHKMILDRISKGSIGFGATVRSIPGTSANTTDPNSNQHETILEGEDELFEKYLPYYNPPSDQTVTQKSKRSYNTLDLVEPQDLQKYGIIPELVGRLPVSCALSSLSTEALVKVLTEPRNSLLKQFEQLLGLSGIELRFTSAALHRVAEMAGGMGTGARGLRTVMERLLSDVMFEGPGTGVRHVLVTEAVADRKQPCVMFGRGQNAKFHAMIAAEEEEWEERRRRERAIEEGDNGEMGIGGSQARTFEEYREKEKVGAAAF